MEDRNGRLPPERNSSRRTDKKTSLEEQL